MDREELKNKYLKKTLKPIPLLDGIEEMRQDFEDRTVQGDVTYGVEILDECVETIRKKSVTMIIAAPNSGKSLLSQWIAVNLAKQNKKVLICSCEMGAGLLMERQIKNLAGQSAKRLREFYTHDRDHANALLDSFIEDARYSYLKNIDICETSGADALEIIELMDCYPEYHYVVIDYIQRVKGCVDFESLSAASGIFQAHARETGKSLIICSQASRSSVSDAKGDENRKNNIIDPTKLKGKGSGSLEEDADVGLSLLELKEDNKKFILMTLFKNRYDSKKNITYKYSLDERLNFKLIQRYIEC